MSRATELGAELEAEVLERSPIRYVVSKLAPESHRNIRVFIAADFSTQGRWVRSIEYAVWFMHIEDAAAEALEHDGAVWCYDLNTRARYPWSVADG